MAPRKRQGQEPLPVFSEPSILHLEAPNSMACKGSVLREEPQILDSGGVRLSYSLPRTTITIMCAGSQYEALIGNLQNDGFGS